MIRQIYTFLASVKLAMLLLVTILACCMIGVTIFRGERAWSLIFSTTWFNFLLVLLVVNVSFCFFPKMWIRKLTLVNLGMILFHLSFVALLAGIIYNSLFYFRGSIRLTEGETLPTGELQSYDRSDRGRLFNLSKLKGETSLVKMHMKYTVGGSDKRAAYEITVGEGGAKKRDIIYVTKSLTHKGFSYFNDKEGYSLLILLYDKSGKELYGAHVPLQSLRQKDGTYLYTTGTKEAPGSFPFPQVPLNPFMALRLAFRPDPFKERSGDVVFRAGDLERPDVEKKGQPIAEGKAALGKKFRAGDYYLSAQEVRYWASMNVRYEPGKPVVLASLTLGLAGIIMTFFGRLRRLAD